MASKSITIGGTIHSIGETKQVSAKMSKRELVILTDADTKYPNHIPVELIGDKVSAIDGYRVGDSISLECNLRGREWHGPNGTKVFLSLSLWKVNGGPAVNRSASSEPAPTTGYGGSAGTDDPLPF